MSSTLRPWTIAFALAGAASVSAWQTPQASLPEGKGSIRGQVIDATSGAPVSGATVTVARQYTAGSRSVQADAAGEFVIDRLPADTLSLSARQGQNYLGGRYGQRSADATEQPFELADGEQATGVELRLWRNAVISGRVTDAKGAAIPGVTVQAVRMTIVNGVRSLQAGMRVQSDATGRYRIDRVWPGRYGVAILGVATDGFFQGGGASAAFAGYPTTYYPAASSADGPTLFNLTAGDERDGVDFTLTTGPLVSAEGTVEGLPPGARSPFVELLAVESQSSSTHMAVAKAVVRTDGRFRFRGIPPGSYVLRTVVFPAAERMAGTRPMTQSVSPNGFGISGGGEAELPLAPLPATPTLWAALPVTIPNGDVIGLTLKLKPAFRVHGQVEFCGGSPKPGGDQLMRTPIAIMGTGIIELTGLPGSRIEADGRFSTVGLPPGKYSVVLLTGAFLQSRGWDPIWRQQSFTLDNRAISSIDVEDKDVSGIVVTFSDARPTELSGAVHDGTGRVRPDATIYVFPVNRQDWSGAREVRPGRSGRYVASSLPPREYFVAAVTDEATELWREHAFLEKLTLSAARVTIAPSENKVVNLSVR